MIFPPEPSKECVKVIHVIFESRVINHHPKGILHTTFYTKHLIAYARTRFKGWTMQLLYKAIQATIGYLVYNSQLLTRQSQIIAITHYSDCSLMSNFIIFPCLADNLLGRHFNTTSCIQYTLSSCAQANSSCIQSNVMIIQNQRLKIL